MMQTMNYISNLVPTGLAKLSRCTLIYIVCMFSKDINVYKIFKTIISNYLHNMVDVFAALKI